MDMHTKLVNSVRKDIKDLENHIIKLKEKYQNVIHENTELILIISQLEKERDYYRHIADKQCSNCEDYERCKGE